MSEISASPTTRQTCPVEGRRHRRPRPRPRAHHHRPRGPRSGRGPCHARSADASYWAVDHARFGPVREEPMSRFAQVAAKNLAAAQALIPAVTHHDRADVSAIEALRAAWKPEAQARGVKLTALAFHVAALARALGAFPIFNSSLSADGKTLFLKDYVHIGIAVDTGTRPDGAGHPRRRPARACGRSRPRSADLAARAQARRIGPDEMGGGPR